MGNSCVGGMFFLAAEQVRPRKLEVPCFPVMKLVFNAHNSRNGNIVLVRKGRKVLANLYVANHANHGSLSASRIRLPIRANKGIVLLYSERQ